MIKMTSQVSQPARGTASRLPPALVKIIAVVMLGALMMQLDMTMTTIATRTLVHDFRSPLTTIQWVTTGYLLAMAATIPLAGWALERFGARAVWMTSIAIFLLGSVLCGLAWSPRSLIGFRVLQGLGAGMVMPVGQAVLVQAAPPDKFGRVICASTCSHSSVCARTSASQAGIQRLINRRHRVGGHWPGGGCPAARAALRTSAGQSPAKAQ
jgi:MFS family permease